MKLRRTVTSSVVARGWVAYIAPVAFPEGSAGSRRVLGIARSLAAAGRRVVVIAGMDRDQPMRKLEAEANARGSVEYKGVGEYDSRWSVPKKLRYMLFDDGFKSVRWLDAQDTVPEAVILYGSSCPAWLRMRSWCRQRKVPLIGDVIEWYASGQVAGGRFAPVFWCNEYSMRRLLPHADGIIAISTYLQRYFARRHRLCVLVPPTLDLEVVQPRLADSPRRDRIELVYAGVPGKKDLLANVILGLRLADPNAEKFHMTVLGPREQDVARLCGQWNRDQVTIAGRRTHRQVLQTVSDADFSILLRRAARYAQAGFPTKVVESMACGTPVICNVTGDLGDHVKDMVTGVVCLDSTPMQFAAALDRVCKLGAEKLDAMRAAARKHAEDVFDYRQYSLKLDAFLRECASSYVSNATVQGKTL